MYPTKRDEAKWDKRRSDNDDNVDDRYHGGASSMLTRRDFRGYNLKKETLRARNFANARLWFIIYAVKYLILRYEAGYYSIFVPTLRRVII